MNTIRRKFVVPNTLSNADKSKIIQHYVDRVGVDLVARASIESPAYFTFNIEINKSDCEMMPDFTDYEVLCQYIFTPTKEVTHTVIKYEDMNWSKLSATALQEIWRRIKRLFS